MRGGLGQPLIVVILAAMAFVPRGGAEVTFSWPTPNTAYREGLPFDAYVQPTVSGEVVSGLFGCVRTDGTQFHEAIDLKPVKRDRRGEPLDKVMSIQDGVVAYINKKAGNSSFGNYVVIEHPGLDMPIVSLYAHLKRVADGLRVGDPVSSGEIIGTMGRTAAGYSIPRERAHLHLETALWLSRNFQDWYDAQEYGNRNTHGVYNGMNVVGFDFHDLLDRMATGEVNGVADYLTRQPSALTVEMATDRVPDFVRRYPKLLTRSLPPVLAGWRVDVTWYGLPVRWTPLETDPSGLPDRVAVVFDDHDQLERHPCLDLVKRSGGQVRPGTRLKRLFEILFAR